MTSDFDTVFERLRGILRKHAGELTVSEDSVTRYCLEGQVGPATLRAWGGKEKTPMIPVAWVQIGKAYVSFHLMGVYGNAKLLESMPQGLKKRMQGKTCFNFSACDDQMFNELDALTLRACAGFRRAGFIR
jgi:hypothetical protein